MTGGVKTMKKSKIEYTDYTWNPITGCRHNCPYCYAEKMSHRFCGDIRQNKITADYTEKDGLFVINNEIQARNGRSVLFPFGFAPTLHINRLEKNCKPQKVLMPSKFFVGSLCDLFGEWVPDEWIERVFKVCEENPQHTYLFLTKNSKRYFELHESGKLPRDKNMWYGTTITKADDLLFKTHEYKTFISFEPLHENMESVLGYGDADWVIVGAETGQRRHKIIPEKEWIENIYKKCKAGKIPLFIKNNAAGVWGKKLIQQYPWED